MKEFWNKWKQFFERKLIMPMKRRHKDPRYVARATMIGLGGSFIPFPVQMPFVFIIWVIGRRLKWRFSLVIGLAWTFVSNTFTNLPIMYAFYLTGNKMRGLESNMSYRYIVAKFDDGLLHGLKDMVTEYGYSIVVGSVPYIIVFGFLGYFLGYYVSVYHWRKKEKEEITAG